ncbi:nitronate monooxygenase [Thalassobius vesicularis]|uniref:Nitronate monooxygenase n=1 Tax=Thalassobius vesicularis TaxID=1294297 RepID=A0A4V6RRX5_9RHOB|nr:nitronate monooxygenase [Thalassobius vesicularis]THD75779.1 nitronate monooxygenase [Thalassobius vesicularis]
MTDLLQRLGLDCPIFQAPMAGVATPALAAAVSNGGALGALGLGASDAATAQRMIQETKALTVRPFNVNLFCHRPAVADAAKEAAWLAHMAPQFALFGAVPPSALSEIYQSFLTDDAMLQVLVQERPAVISLHFGLPDAERLAALKATGAVLLATATSLEEAQAIQAAGLDGIVAQGIEAGGHRGMFDPEAPDARLGTLALVRLLTRHVDLPVIAAGGIMDGAGIKAALSLGAAAAQLGTAFVGCDESAADADYRQALTGPGGWATQLTPAVSGRPARCLRNAYIAWSEDAPRDQLPDYPIAYDAAKALASAARAAGTPGWGAQWAGQGAPMARPMAAGRLLSLLQDELRNA